MFVCICMSEKALKTFSQQLRFLSRCMCFSLSPVPEWGQNTMQLLVRYALIIHIIELSCKLHTHTHLFFNFCQPF